MIQTIPLPYGAPPISANGRYHWAARARLTRQVRREVATLARHHKTRAVDVAEVTWHWRPEVKRRRDDSGPAPSVKAAVDGLVDAGVLPDDTADIVQHRVVIHAVIPGKPAACWLTIDDAGDLP